MNDTLAPSIYQRQFDAALPAVQELVWTLLNFSEADQLFFYRNSGPDNTMEPAELLGALSLYEKQAFWASVLDPATDLVLAQLTQNPGPLEIKTEETRLRYGGSILASFKSRSFLAYPLVNRGQMLGMVIFAWFEQNHALSEPQNQLVQAVMRSMALMLDNTRLYEVSSQQLQQALSMQDITQAILKKVSLDEVLAMIAHQALQITDALGCRIRLVDDNKRLRTAYQIGRVAASPLDDPLQKDLPVESTRLAREPVLFNVAGSPGDEIERYAVLIVPLAEGADVMGCLEIHQRQSYFQPQDITTARSFASQAAVAIENARLYRRIQETAAAEERSRLARDLHDSISQSLYAITLFSRAAKRQAHKGQSEDVEKTLAELDATARSVLAEMRLLIYELRPLDLQAGNLSQALESRLRSVEGHSGIVVEHKLELPVKLPDAMEESLYRIAQEALNNILKHAKASHVSVELGLQAGRVHLEIRDDGLGFAPQDSKGRGMGLENMRERVQQIGGELVLQSSPGQGTIIRVEVPYVEN